jgi:hypothetical protein
MREVRCGLPGRFKVQIDGTPWRCRVADWALQSLLPRTPVPTAQAPLKRGQQRDEVKTQFGAQS